MVFAVLLERESEERNNPQRGRKLTLYLDFTNACWRKNIIAFTVLFLFRIDFKALSMTARLPYREVGTTSSSSSLMRIRFNFTATVLPCSPMVRIYDPH